MKKILYVIIGLLVIYLVLCLAGPSVIKVQRSENINASADAIKSQLTDYNVFTSWSPWAEKDTAMKIIITGVAGNVGHKYAWEGNKEVGKGTMELTKISADTVAEKLDFNGKGVSDVYFIFKPDGATTNVTWAMDMNIGFMGRGMMLFFKGKMDKMLGGDFEKGLTKLKQMMEAAPAVKTYRGYEIKEVTWPERNYYGKKATLGFDKLSGFFAENFPKIFNDIVTRKVQHTGPPSGIFYTYDEQKKETECAAVISVPEGQELKGWEKFNVPATDVALQIAYYGGYTNMANAHGAMADYMKEKGLEHSVVIEEYLSDPMSEKDSTKWLTNIYYVLKGNGGIQIKVQ
jgi:effector-binding domain-containing protein/carbon monoxide dehydrogenase subunit G